MAQRSPRPILLDVDDTQAKLPPGWQFAGARVVDHTFPVWAREQFGDGTNCLVAVGNGRNCYALSEKFLIDGSWATYRKLTPIDEQVGPGPGGR